MAQNYAVINCEFNIFQMNEQHLSFISNLYIVVNLTELVNLEYEQTLRIQNNVKLNSNKYFF